MYLLHLLLLTILTVDLHCFWQEALSLCPGDNEHRVCLSFSVSRTTYHLPSSLSLRCVADVSPRGETLLVKRGAYHRITKDTAGAKIVCPLCDDSVRLSEEMSHSKMLVRF